MLPAEVLRHVRRLQVRARRAVRSLHGGEYRSAFKGSGISFEDVREYQPGDDVRSIDWNVTARAGHPFVKRFIEERELTLILMTDLSGSLHFGSAGLSKRQVCAELAAVLAFAAVRHNDRVGWFGFTDRIEGHLPPRKGGRHILRVLREILLHEPGHPGTNLTLALDQLNRVIRKRAIVILFSDFLDAGYESAFRRAAHRHDLIAIRVSDPREKSWPDAGLVRVEDAETGAQTIIDTSHAGFRESFARQQEERRLAWEKLCRALRVDRIDVGTAGGHFEALVSFFRRREARSRGSHR